MFEFPRWKVWAVTLVVLFGILLAVPSLMSEGQAKQLPKIFPSARISLGLDLAGGSHLLLEADARDADKQRLTVMEEQVSTELRRGGRAAARADAAGRPDRQSRLGRHGRRPDARRADPDQGR